MNVTGDLNSRFLHKLLLLFALVAILNCEIPQTPNGPRPRNLFQFGEPRKRNTNNFQMNNRAARFLSLFTYVQFNNQECVGATGDNGTCVTASECAQKGGTSNGPCAGGFGTCCIFLTSCGTTVRENGTYFVNNGYPNQYSGTGSCQINIVKANANVCQYRLDFDKFNIMGPETTNNVCNNDQFIVTGGSPVPAICGNNVGNHMYIDASPGLNTPITLSMVTSGMSFNRDWKIRITQIVCTAMNRADEGCLQYYTGVAGQIKSFNYDTNTGLQLSNQDYSICIRTERNFCSIQYTQCADPVHPNRSQSFTLSGNTNNVVQAMVGSTGSSNFCQADYLIIPMASNVGRPVTGPSANVDRICGGVLSADVTAMPTTVRSILKPFRIWFHSDGTEAPNDMANKGFCLDYVQQPCTNILT